MYNILVVDDHPIIRDGLRILLKDTDLKPAFENAENGDEAIDKVRSKKYDLVIMDINMPNTDSLGLLSLMKIAQPDIKILIFSVNSERIFAKRFLKLGAMGYLNKDATDDEIIKAVVQILVHKKSFYSEGLMQQVFYDQLHNKQDNPFDALSEREFEVGMYLLKGTSISELSHILKLHTSTVGTHKSRLFEKLEVSNILELNKLAKSFDISF